MPIAYEAGVTGVVVLGSGTFRYTPGLDKAIEGLFRSAVLRFNPKEIGTVVRLDGLARTLDLGAVEMSRHLLRTVLDHCWQQGGNEVLIPDAAAFAAVLYSKEHGDLLISTPARRGVWSTTSRRERHCSRSDDMRDDYGRETPAILAGYAVTQEWGSGFMAEVRLTNDSPAAASFDRLQFDLDSNVTSVSDARMVSHAGTHYVLTNAGYNAAIPAGGTVTIGLVATRGGSTVATGLDVSGGNPSPPPTVPPPPSSPGSRVTFQPTADWGTGMTGQITVANTGTTPLTGWAVGFDFAGPISSVWSGTVRSHVGNRYVVGPDAANTSIPAGGSVDIGFVAGAGGLAATNLTVTGSGGTVAPRPSPTTCR